MNTRLPIFESAFETYQSKAVIGEGGSGRVYEVVDTNGEIFAIKCLASERVTSEKLKRFKNEIGFCSRNTHPNIVRVLDTGFLLKEGKCPFYVMTNYPGTLRSQIGDMAGEDILRVFSKILDGVEAAHLLNVWHRDIKPENILMSASNVVVADFGIAHFSEEDIITAIETKVASRMANFLYAAPEQKIKGASVDFRADIYALGLILNEMFTGQVPQGAGIAPISENTPNYGYLDEVVDSMIQQDPTKRIQNVNAIKEKLVANRNAHIAFQKLSELENEVVPASAPATFVPLKIVGLDFKGETLQLKLNTSPPDGWRQDFLEFRGMRSSIGGYEPERFRFERDYILIPGVREDQGLIQSIVDHAKKYISNGNENHVYRIRKEAEMEDNRKRTELRQQIEREKKRIDMSKALSNIEL